MFMHFVLPPGWQPYSLYMCRSGYVGCVCM